MTVRVVLVDDDDITRVGSAVLLGQHPGIELVASMSHIDAAATMGDWADVDVAVIDACDQRRPEDQFPGVGIVQAVRAHRRSDQTRVVVLTGIMFDDAVRRRMREAHADFYFHRSALRDAAALWEAVLSPTATDAVPDVRDPEQLFRLGVSDRTRVNESIEAAQTQGVFDADPALAPRSRDRMRRRERFNERAQLTPRTADGLPPDRRQSTPSLPQIERFLRWATRSQDGPDR